MSLPRNIKYGLDVIEYLKQEFPSAGISYTCGTGHYIVCVGSGPTRKTAKVVAEELRDPERFVRKLIHRLKLSQQDIRDYVLTGFNGLGVYRWCLEIGSDRLNWRDTEIYWCGDTLLLEKPCQMGYLASPEGDNKQLKTIHGLTDDAIIMLWKELNGRPETKLIGFPDQKAIGDEWGLEAWIPVGPDSVVDVRELGHLLSGEPCNVHTPNDVKRKLIDPDSDDVMTLILPLLVALP
jgi:hypothetical protein